MNLSLSKLFGYWVIHLKKRSLPFLGYLVRDDKTVFHWAFHPICPSYLVIGLIFGKNWEKYFRHFYFYNDPKTFPTPTPSMASDPALVAGEGGGNIRAWLISGMWWRPRHAIRSVTFIVDARWWRIMNEHHLVGAGLYLFSFFMPKDKYFQYTSQGTLSIGPKAHTQCQDKVLISRTFPMKKSISESTQNFCNHINNQQSTRLKE